VDHVNRTLNKPWWSISAAASHRHVKSRDCSMITVGSVPREDAAKRFALLAAAVSGRRKAIKEFTHRDPDYVFWIHPDGRLHDARWSHRDNVSRGYESIVDEEPDYGGFPRSEVMQLPADFLGPALGGVWKELEVGIRLGRLVLTA
jgi:hypothetical protein